MKLGLTGIALALTALGVLSLTALATTNTNAGAITVAPGETKTNGNVTVNNTSTPGADHTATITPGKKAKKADGSGGGTPTGANNVRTKDHVTSATTGLTNGDTVDLGNNNNGSVTGSGGTVNLGSSNNITVTNNGTTGGGPINVNYNNGNSATVPPGSTATFHS